MKKLTEISKSIGTEVIMDDNGKVHFDEAAAAAYIEAEKNAVTATPASIPTAQRRHRRRAGIFAEATPAPAIVSEPQPKAKADKPVIRAMAANVAGTTFEHHGHNAQEILERLAVNKTAFICRLNAVDFEGKPALEVWVFPLKNGKLIPYEGPDSINGIEAYQVGYVAAKNGDLPKALSMVDTVGGTKPLKVTPTIVGGHMLANGEQLNYGLRLRIEI